MHVIFAYSSSYGRTDEVDRSVAASCTTRKSALEMGENKRLDRTHVFARSGHSKDDAFTRNARKVNRIERRACVRIAVAVSQARRRTKMHVDLRNGGKTVVFVCCSNCQPDPLLFVCLFVVATLLPLNVPRRFLSFYRFAQLCNKRRRSECGVEKWLCTRSPLANTFWFKREESWLDLPCFASSSRKTMKMDTHAGTSKWSVETLKGVTKSVDSHQNTHTRLMVLTNESSIDKTKVMLVKLTHGLWITTLNHDSSWTSKRKNNK